MKSRQKTTASFRAKQKYLLSGKIICGECGCTYAGNSRKPTPTHPLYVSYRCTKKNGKIQCKNSEIQREIIEKEILKRLADKKIYENALFDKEKELDKITVDKKGMKRAFKKAKNMLMSGTLTNRKAIVENYVKQIIIYKDKITVEFNVMDNYSVTEEIYRCEL